jgi:hypothetical protein
VLGSFGVSVALSKTAVLAGPALLYPVWGPWIRAGGWAAAGWLAGALTMCSALACPACRGI